MGQKMPIKYVIEMFMDRVAASKTYQGSNYTDRQPLEYYEKGAAKPWQDDTPGDSSIASLLLKMLAEEGEEKPSRYIRRKILKMGNYLLTF